MKKPHKLCDNCLNLGKKRTAIKICKYCNRNFCEDHINPEVVSYADKKLRAVIKGHRCLEFEEYKKLQEEELNRKVIKVLDEMKEAESEERKILRPQERPEISSLKTQSDLCHKCHKKLREDTNYCIYCRRYFCNKHYKPKDHKCQSLEVYPKLPSISIRLPSFQKLFSAMKKVLWILIIVIALWFVITFIWPVFRLDALIFFITNFYKISLIDLITFDPTVLIIITMFLIIGVIGTIFPSFLGFLERHTYLSYIFGIAIALPLFLYGYQFFSGITTIDNIAYLQAKLSFDEVNHIRQGANIQPLIWDDKLYELAKYRAKDMVERQYFSHYSPEGYDISDYASQFGIINLGISENIGMGYYNVKHVIEGWKNSPGHYSNLLFGNKGAVAVHGDKYVYVSCVC